MISFTHSQIPLPFATTHSSKCNTIFITIPLHLFKHSYSIVLCYSKPLKLIEIALLSYSCYDVLLATFFILIKERDGQHHLKSAAECFVCLSLLMMISVAALGLYKLCKPFFFHLQTRSCLIDMQRSELLSKIFCIVAFGCFS